jgi:arsenate reductase
MAAGWLKHLAGDRVEVRSAGSEPADRINPIAVAAMAEVDIDIANEQPKVLTVDEVSRATVVVTMGCGDACPYFPGQRYEDWELTDPAGLAIDQVRSLRDDIERRVKQLLSELTATMPCFRPASTLLDPPVGGGVSVEVATEIHERKQT